MKKSISLLLCLLLMSVLVLPASANETKLPKVVDEAGLLTEEEIADLSDKAALITDAYDMDVVILTVWSLDGKTAYDYADDYYDNNGYGIGPEYSGVLFLLAMESREWYISTCGDAIYAVTDYSISQIGDSVVNYLSDGDYYGGFDAFLRLLGSCYQSYAAGDPIDAPKGSYDDSNVYYPGDETLYYEEEGEFFPGLIIVSLVVGGVIAAVAILFMRSSMNTKRPRNSAGDYLKSGTFYLRQHSDIFLYSRTHKTRRESSSSGAGGSSVRRSSGGRRHGGGGGRF